MAKYKNNWLNEDYEETNFQKIKRKSNNKKKSKDGKKKRNYEESDKDW